MSTFPPISPAPADRLARSVRAAARFSARRPKLVIALWLVLIAGCGIGGALVGTRTLSDAASGSGESGHAEQRLQQAGLLNRFDESLIVRSSSPARTRQITAGLAAAARHTRYVASVTAPASHPSLERDGGRIALVDVTVRGNPDQQANRVAPLEHVVAAAATSAKTTAPGAYVGEAGDGSFDQADNTTVSSGLGTAELIAVPLTLLILALVSGALVAAVVPLLLGLTSVGAAMGALGLVSQIAPNGSTTASVVLLIGLAVGVDYSLFYIRRERAERRAGHGPEGALDAAAATVGRAVLIAGATVIVGLVGLLFTGSPVFMSMALGAILVVSIAVLGSLTVLPATLALLGDRIERGRIGRRRRRTPTNPDATASGPSIWTRVAEAVTGRPVLSFLLATALLCLLAAPVLSMRTGNPGSADLPHDNPTVVAQHLIDAHYPGATDTAQLVITGHDLDSRADRAQLRTLGAQGRRLAGGAGGQISLAVAHDGDTAVVGIPVPSGGGSVQRHNVTVLRTRLKPATARAIPGAQAQLTGDDAGNVDFSHQMAEMTPLVIAFVLALAFVLLVAAFRSPLLALSVIGLNLLSVGAAFGVLTELFQARWAGSALHLSSFGAIVSWLPLFAFVILFGLSMDYTVLILERASEARRRGASAREATAEALGATGSTVTSAALVMVSVFAIFATVPLISFKQLGIGLAAAIAIDATIVRGVALPAVLTLLGDRGLRGSASRPASDAVEKRERDHGPELAWDHRVHAAIGDIGHD